MRDAGLMVLAAFISPFRNDRAMVLFLEVFVDAPLAVIETAIRRVYTRA